MKQPFCPFCGGRFQPATVGGDAVSIVAAQLVGGRVGCGLRTAASRLVVVVVDVSRRERSCRAQRGKEFFSSKNKDPDHMGDLQNFQIMDQDHLNDLKNVQIKDQH